MQEAAVCSFSGTENVCLGAACLETVYNTQIMDLFCVVSGLRLHCY